MHRSVSTILFALALLFGGCARSADPWSAKSIVERLEHTRTIEVESLGLDVVEVRRVFKDGEWVEEEGPHYVKRFRFSEAGDVSRVVAEVVIDDEPFGEPMEFLTPDGKTEVGYPPCLCAGDFQIGFVMGDGSRLDLTIHHDGKFLRYRSDPDLHEWRLLAPHGEKLNVMLTEKLKEANQALQTTPVTRSEI